MNLKFFSFVYHLVRFSGLHSALEMGENSAIINSNGGYIQLGKKLNFVKKGRLFFISYHQQERKIIQNVYIYCRLKQDLFL